MELTVARALTIDAGGADALELPAVAGQVLVVTAEAFARWHEQAVWCELTGITTDRNELRFAVHGAYAVLEVEVDGDRQRALAPAASAPGWFWATCGLWSSFPGRPLALDPALFDVVDGWARGEEVATDGLPRAQRLRVGIGADLMREDFLIMAEDRWVRCRRVELEDGPMVAADAFSMKELVLDLSALLAGALAGD